MTGEPEKPRSVGEGLEQLLEGLKEQKAKLKALTAEVNTIGQKTSVLENSLSLVESRVRQLRDEAADRVSTRATEPPPARVLGDADELEQVDQGAKEDDNDDTAT